jgi:diguanylate cyclase (GGDEF)-like protein
MTDAPSSADQAVDQEPLLFSAGDLDLQLAVTSAILQSLDIDQVLYVVLSGLTSGEGLGFNRGLILLADEGQRAVRTSMAIGPVDEDEAHRIWEDIEAKDLRLGTLLAVYGQVKDDPAAHRLTQRLGHLSVALEDLGRLAEKSAAPSQTATVPMQAMLARCLLERAPLGSTTVELVCARDADAPVAPFRNWFMVPLLSPERVFGALVVDDTFSARVLTARRRHLLLALAGLTTIAVDKARLFARMRALAEIDGLTGLANRRAYDSALDRLLTEARQTGRTVSLVLLDIDYFKSFNDRFGHLAGDDVLREVAAALCACSRRADLVARYGGEELAVLCPNTTLEQAVSVAEKLAREVRERPTLGASAGRVTVSAGVASSPAGVLDAEALFEAADRAMYEAKRRGRDRIEWAGRREG